MACDPGALLVSGAINLFGALLVILVMPAYASDDRMASAWVLVQFLSGVWAGVLGANSPFLHGLVAGLPALALGLSSPNTLPAQFVVLSLVRGALRRTARRGHDALHAPPQGARPQVRRRSCVASPNVSS